jgi:hypothetical protein
VSLLGGKPEGDLDSELRLILGLKVSFLLYSKGHSGVGVLLDGVVEPTGSNNGVAPGFLFSLDGEDFSWLCTRAIMTSENIINHSENGDYNRRRASREALQV